MLFNTEVNIIIFLHPLIICTDLECVGSDMILDIEFSQIDVQKDIVSPIKVNPDDQVCSEVIFVVLGVVSKLSVTMRRSCACRTNYMSKVAAWGYQWLAASIIDRVGQAGMVSLLLHHLILVGVYKTPPPPTCQDDKEGVLGTA